MLLSRILLKLCLDRKCPNWKYPNKCSDWKCSGWKCPHWIGNVKIRSGNDKYKLVKSMMPALMQNVVFLDLLNCDRHRISKLLNLVVSCMSWTMYICIFQSFLIPTLLSNLHLTWLCHWQPSKEAICMNLKHYLFYNCKIILDSVTQNGARNWRTPKQ